MSKLFHSIFYSPLNLPLSALPFLPGPPPAGDIFLVGGGL